MRLAELVNRHYNELNENDLMIWQYIQEHKKACSEISIEELSSICCISRTTISRFTQKLGFDGFREFKLHLKFELELHKDANNALLEDVISDYHKCIDTMKDVDLTEVFQYLEQANRLFVYGTGEVQNAASKMIKRMFLNTKRFFITLYGKNELMMAIENMDMDDFIIIISLSGENPLAIEAAQKLRAKGGYIVSITELSNNTVAKIAHKNLYISGRELMNIGGTIFESSAAYFNVVELFCVKYLLYLQEKDAK